VLCVICRVIGCNFKNSVSVGILLQGWLANTCDFARKLKLLGEAAKINETL